MRLSVVLLLCLLFAGGCSQETKQPVRHLAFRYRGEYYPSFMPPCIITIEARDSVNHITLRVYDDRKNKPVTILADSANLSPTDLLFFFTKLDSIPVLKLRTSTYPPGTDGITVYNTISQDTSQNKFKFWSPTRQGAPQEHKLVEAVVGLSRRKFTVRKEQEYFESLEQYFDFGLPCKITSTDPFEVRIYGGLSSNNDQALSTFIHQLPSDCPILIDMSNFNGMGTMFYPLFRSLLVRNHHLVWVASGYSQSQLVEIGVPKDSITSDLANGHKVIQRLATTPK